MSMNRADLMREVAEEAGFPLNEVDRVCGALFEVVSRNLADGRSINLRRFGKFEPRLRRPASRRNPRNGAQMEIPQRVSAVFLPSSTLKERMNSGT